MVTHRTYIAHLCSLLLVSSVFSTLFFCVRTDGDIARKQAFAEIAPYVNLPDMDLSLPLHKTLLRESLDVFYPDRKAANDSLAAHAQLYAAMDVAELQRLLRSGDGLTWDGFLDMAGMYVVFALVYVAVMGLTCYGVETLAVYRYVREKQGALPPTEAMIALIRAGGPGRIKKAVSLLPKTVGAAFGLMMLFSPAYVLAYSFRSRFDTDTLSFMAVLGVLSNGLLITYTRKFYTFLIAEGRKGYVETAMVKNLDDDYSFSFRELCRVRKRFPGHVFYHVYLNARYQYLPTLKEQASFLISGLIIIEMALNIHGHLCYELLQHLLYKRYDAALTILMGIFLIVKTTEIGVDLWKDRETRRYENI
ncbi:MAG: hypothetical protein FJY97_12125 [candidate division Zixibacteria bacterium]|nr:hypothetical protein [candidate division Zixibacteria bacterium]